MKNNIKLSLKMSQNTVLCRLCLGSDVCMFPIAGTSLQHIFERITDTIINKADLKPVYACYMCYAHLKTCNKLMLTSMKAEQALNSILENDHMVSKQSVAKVVCARNNPFSFLKTRPVEYFDISTYENSIMVKDEPTIVDDALVKEDLEFVNVKELVGVDCEDLGTSESAEICRICLAVDVRMATIADTPLQRVYEIITNNILQTADSRPETACYLCHAQLRRCHMLMQKASNTEELMTAILKEYSELTPERVKMVDRNSKDHCSSLRKTPVECYSSLSYEPSIVNGGFEVTVKIEVEPDLFVGSPLPDTLSDTEYPKNQSDVAEDIPKTTQRTMRSCRKRVAATETTECCASADQPKPVRRKRTRKPKDSNAKPVIQEKKEKPRRVYKKRIRAYIHECPICKRFFNRTNHLKDHIKTHTDDRPFQCNTCQKRFIQKNNLKIHLLTHTGEKPFECEICHTAFIARSDLNRHLNIHKEEKLFKCSICPRSFRQMSYLKGHISTHTDEKPHECHICQKRFSQKPYLKHHLKRHEDGRLS